MNWKPAILRVWKRMEAKAILIGFISVVCALWLSKQFNRDHIVTLEFVRMVTGSSIERGALAEFRLRNDTLGEITYYGDKAEEPLCDVHDVPFVAGQETSEGGIASHIPHPAASYYFGPGKPFVVGPGEESTLYARVLRANGPWQLVMDYHEDSTGWWARFVPKYFHGWLIPQRTLGPAIKLKSEVLDIKVRGLDLGQRYTLMQHRMSTTRDGRPMFEVVTNLNGSFNLKFIQRTEVVRDEVK